MKISNILQDSKVSESVTVSGWVLTCRKQKNMSFIKLNDGSQILIVSSSPDVITNDFYLYIYYRLL